MRQPKPHKRAGYWYLVRRVPKAYSHLDKRSLICLSTGIPIVDDPRGTHAARVVAELNATLEQGWRDLEAGNDPGQPHSYERARRLATQFGLPYVPAAELADSQFNEIMRRLDALERVGSPNDPKIVEAALGGVEPPELMLSGLMDEFEDIQRASILDMSPSQKRRWRLNKERNIQTLISVVGNKRVRDLTRADALALRDYWQKRIVAGEVQIGHANKEMGGVRKVLRVVEDARQLGIPDVFGKLRIEGGKEKQRAAYDPDFIQNVILAEGALADINEEARRVIYVCADSGLRPVEVVNLTPDCIHLNAEVPYVEIKPVGRRLKTDQSERKIPLVGCALAAMKLQPKGFPRYFDKSDTLSAHVNKAMELRGMRPTSEHTLYSLRHTFEDRLTALDPPDKIIATLMGHKHARPKYGDGPSLKHLQSWLNRIAFRPPGSM